MCVYIYRSSSIVTMIKKGSGRMGYEISVEFGTIIILLDIVCSALCIKKMNVKFKKKKE